MSGLWLLTEAFPPLRAAAWQGLAILLSWVTEIASSHLLCQVKNVLKYDNHNRLWHNGISIETYPCTYASPGPPHHILHLGCFNTNNSPIPHWWQKRHRHLCQAVWRVPGRMQWSLTWGSQSLMRKITREFTLKCYDRDFPGSLVVKIPHFQLMGVTGLIPGWGTQLPCDAQWGQK